MTTAQSITTTVADVRDVNLRRMQRNERGDHGAAHSLALVRAARDLDDVPIGALDRYRKAPRRERQPEFVDVVLLTRRRLCRLDEIRDRRGRKRARDVAR